MNVGVTTDIGGDPRPVGNGYDIGADEFQLIPNVLPQVQATSPLSGAVDVAIQAPIVITFSEAINPSTFAYTVSPNPGSWSLVWSSDGRVVTLSHAPSAYQTHYTVTITAEDLAGSLLVDAPYAWSFTTLAQPTGQHRIYLPMVTRNR